MFEACLPGSLSVYHIPNTDRCAWSVRSAQSIRLTIYPRDFLHTFHLENPLTGNQVIFVR